jgi:membrane protein DedA with SNARE-associated domain
MIDPISAIIGLLCGGAAGYIGGRIARSAEITQYRDEIFVRDQLLDNTQRKLRALTSRDSKGRFNGSSKPPK